MTGKLTGRRWSPVLIAVLLGSILATGGCSTQKNFFERQGEAPRTGDVSKVEMMWQDHICYAPDTLHNGQPVPVIAGRMYLAGGPDGATFFQGDGTVTVELYDNSEPAATGAKPPKYRWTIDPATMPKLLKKDPVGWGYTVFLPLWDYQPDLNRVYLRVKYSKDHDNGPPAFDPGHAMVLNKDLDMHVASHTVPGGFQMKGNLTGSMPAQTQPGTITQASYNTAASGNVPGVASGTSRSVIPLPTHNGRVSMPAPPTAAEAIPATGTISPVSAAPQMDNVEARSIPSGDGASARTEAAIDQSRGGIVYPGPDAAAAPNVPAGANPVTFVQPPAPTGGVRRLVIPGGGSGIQQQNIWPPPGQ